MIRDVGTGPHHFLSRDIHPIPIGRYTNIFNIPTTLITTAMFLAFAEFADWVKT